MHVDDRARERGRERIKRTQYSRSDDHSSSTARAAHCTALTHSPTSVLPFCCNSQLILKMKATVATAVFLLVASFFCCLFGSSLAQSEQQRQALENVDVDNILRNEKLVHRHIACVLDNGRCDTNGRDLKGNYYYYYWPFDYIICNIIRYSCRYFAPLPSSRMQRLLSQAKRQR